MSSYDAQTIVLCQDASLECRYSRHVEFKSHLPHYDKSITLPILLREITSHIQNVVAWQRVDDVIPKADRQADRINNLAYFCILPPGPGLLDLTRGGVPSFFNIGSILSVLLCATNLYLAFVQLFHYLYALTLYDATTCHIRIWPPHLYFYDETWLFLSLFAL